jgi:hypothetical protein
MNIANLKPCTALSAAFTLILSLALGGGFAAPARAAFIVSPGAQAAVEGNDANRLPFDITPFGAGSMRYQQVFKSTDFVSLTGPARITQITFRPDFQLGSAFSATLPNVRIDLSTTSAAPDALSTAFANNVGGDDTTVFSGALPLSSAKTGPAAGPKDFDIVINLTTPFVYDRSAGNLLLDVRNFSGGTTTTFDAQTTVGDTVSRVWVSDVNAATGQTPDTEGLVTRFTTSPVPEPSTGALLAFGFPALLGAARLRGRKG